MLARNTAPVHLLALILFCLALLLAVPTEAAQNVLYTTELEKSVAAVVAADTSVFSIPSGQCSGYIDQKLLCGARRAVAVRLTVRDATFAALRVDDALHSATITRGRCDGAAEVELRVACSVAPRPSAAPSPLR